MQSFVAGALAQNPEASSKQIAVRWRSLRGETVEAEELDLLSDVYEHQAPAAREANAGVREAQQRIDSPHSGSPNKKLLDWSPVWCRFCFPWRASIRPGGATSASAA